MILRVWGFRNPINFSPIGGFVLRTMSGVGLIEVSASLQLSVSQPAIIKTATATLESGSTQVMGVSNIRLDFTSPIPYSAGCTLQITVPTDFANLRLSLSAVKVYGLFGFIKSIPFTVSDQVIQATGACQAYSDNSQASIRLEGLQNPSIVKDTASFKLVVADSFGNVLAMTQSQLNLPASSFSPGLFTSGSVQLLNPTVQEPTGLVMTLLPSNKLTQEGRILVTLPAEFTLNSNSTVIPTTLKNIDATQIQCVANTTSNKFLVRQLFFSFGYLPKVDGPISFNLTNIIAANPNQTLSGQSIKVQTYDLVAAATTLTKAVYGLVDEILIPTDGLVSPGSFRAMNFTIDSDTVNTFPANATVTVTVAHNVLAGQQVFIYLPADIGIAQLQSKCTNAVGFVSSSPSCTIKSQTDGSTLVVVDGLKAQSPGAQISLKLTALRMPRYQGKLQGQVVVATGSNSGAALIDRKSQDFFTAKAFEFDGFTMQQGSQVCSAVTTLTMTINKPISLALKPSDMLAVTLPANSSFTFNSTALTCTLNGAQQSCFYDGLKKILTVQNFQDALTLQLTINGLVNAVSLKPPVSVGVSLIDSNMRLLATTSQAISTVLSVTQASIIGSFQTQQSSTQPSAASDFSFTFASVNLPATVFASVDLPACMIYSSVTALSLDGSFSQLQSQLVGPQRISVRLPIGPTTPGFMLRGLINPSETCQASVSVSLFEDAQLTYLMATAQFLPSLSCQNLCTSCLTERKDFCTACKTGYFLNAESGTCSLTCPAGSIQDLESSSCQKCHSSCSTCKDSTDFCLSCSDSSFVATHEGTCISASECGSDSSKFANSSTGTCDQCEAPCKKCSDQGCLLCQSEFYLLRGLCVSDCPVGTIKSFTGQGYVCENEPSRLIAWKLISDIPLAYITVVLFSLAVTLKMTCLRQMSLLVTFVIISNLIETISLAQLFIVAVKDSSVSANLVDVEKGFFRFTPLGVLLMVLLINVYVVANHFSALKPGGKASAESKAEYETWVNERISRRTVIYTVACLCSFHNINWFNFLGLFPDSLKRRLIRQKFVAFYTSVCKFSMVFPRTLMVAYCAYFGVFNAFGKIKLQSEGSTDLIASVVEHGFLSGLSIFLLFLALNFSWYDDPVQIIEQHELQKKAYAEQPGEAPPKMYVPKSSFDLHMLKSSQVLRSKAQQVKTSIDSMAFGFTARAKEVQLTDVQAGRADQTANTTGIELIDPEVPVLPAKGKQEPDLNFDFLESMKQTIIKSRRGRKGKFDNASDGKQNVRSSYNSSDRTIKTQRFQQKHLTVGGSPVPRLVTKPLEQIEDISQTSRTVESNEVEPPVVSVKKAPSAMSASTARTKVESLIRDFDQELFPQSQIKSNFESPKSIDVSPKRAKHLSTFAKN